MSWGQQSKFVRPIRGGLLCGIVYIRLMQRKKTGLLGLLVVVLNIFFSLFTFGSLRWCSLTCANIFVDCGF